MADVENEIAALRHALADAERMRDDAIARHAALEARCRDDLVSERHYLRNTIAMVRGIVHHTGEDVDAAEDYCILLDARLAAYLRAQGALSGDPARGFDLELLILDELLTFGIGEDDRVRLSGPAIELTRLSAGLMALVVHDLVSRLFTGDVEWKDGRLRVDWSVGAGPDDGWLLLDWAETGSDDDRCTPRSAWGQSLPHAVEYQLGGSMAVTAEAGIHSVGFRLPAACFQVVDAVGGRD